MGSDFSYPICNAATIDVKIEIQRIKKKKTKRSWFSFGKIKIRPEEETVEIIEKIKQRISPLDYFKYTVDETSTVKIIFLKKPKPFEHKTHQCRKDKGIIITRNLEILECNKRKKPWISGSKDYEQECKEWKKDHENFKQEKKGLQDKHASEMAEIDNNYSSLKWQQEKKTENEMKQLRKNYGKKDNEEEFISSDDEEKKPDTFGKVMKKAKDFLD
ncbi:Hypothetical predicted protein [Mytilus galloprovincialis]|uniref:Uncharacterized protein n=1 Tax=Mytilus galloprovincialis TaxID=29158 RepID=A0A8B6G893_MYTGA|nr:Hypothetical predicted protein [Mytilus galloprovincialis]